MGNHQSMRESAEKNKIIAYMYSCMQGAAIADSILGCSGDAMLLGSGKGGGGDIGQAITE